MTDALFTRQSWASEGSRGFSSAQLLRCDERRKLGFPPSRHSREQLSSPSINCTRGRFWCVCMCDGQSWKWRQSAYWLINRAPFRRCVDNHNREWMNRTCINAPTQQANATVRDWQGSVLYCAHVDLALRRFDIQASKQTHWSHSHLIKQIQW